VYLRQIEASVFKKSYVVILLGSNLDVDIGIWFDFSPAIETAALKANFPLKAFWMPTK
jgi:hypothetical protein